MRDSANGACESAVLEPSLWSEAGGCARWFIPSVPKRKSCDGDVATPKNLFLFCTHAKDEGKPDPEVEGGGIQGVSSPNCSAAGLGVGVTCRRLGCSV